MLFACVTGLSSQVTSSQLWPIKSRKRGRPTTSDVKESNPPKKRGRPKKDTNLNSPFTAQQKGDVNIEENEAPKPKWYSTFILWSFCLKYTSVL